MRLVCAIVLVVGMALPARAQSERGWSFSGSFSGSSNSDGTVTKAEPMLGYVFNNHVETYAGVPFYFVNLSPASTTTATSTNGWTSGLGNAFVGFRVSVPNDKLNYSSTLELTAPTGDKSRGFSTGRVTADWTNRFSHRFDSFTPFGSFGIANTISDTAFFVRPFTSLGLVGHFEGGGSYDLSKYVRIAASAYAVRAAGDQTIISKVVKRSSTTSTTTTSSSNRGRGGDGEKNRVFETETQTVVSSDLANDHGASAWVSVGPRTDVDFHVGYSRSMPYDFNSLFFGVGFRVGK
jgi:hypothetical protein